MSQDFNSFTSLHPRKWNEQVCHISWNLASREFRPYWISELNGWHSYVKTNHKLLMTFKIMCLWLGFQGHRATEFALLHPVLPHGVLKAEIQCLELSRLKHILTHTDVECDPLTSLQTSPQLKQRVKRQWGHMWLPPPFCPLLHVLLKLDPPGLLPPLHHLIPSKMKFIQLNKHLSMTSISSFNSLLSNFYTYTVCAHITTASMTASTLSIQRKKPGVNRHNEYTIYV